jgi:hypothetical protein
MIMTSVGFHIKGKAHVKVNFTLEQAMKAQLYSFFNLSASWECAVNATSRLLYPRGRDPVPVIDEAGWAPEPVWIGVENLGPGAVRSPDHPACSMLLY